MSTRPRTFAALRAIIREHGGGNDALAGLTELAGLLGGRGGLSPDAATRWTLWPNATLGDRRPLDVWLEGRADRVIDAARGTPR